MKKSRGSCVKPQSLLVENSSSGGMVRGAGFEPVKAPFTALPASDVCGDSLPFIARRIANQSLCLQVFCGNQWHL
jgi:hypothetical protein